MRPKPPIGEKPRKVLYLDFDGTVRHGKEELGRFVNKPDDVVIFKEAVTMIHRYKKAGYRIVGISNQGGIALGYITQADCAAAMQTTNILCGNAFDKILWCSHHPDAKDPEWARCWCRKPRIGLIIEGCLRMSQDFKEYYPPHMALFVGDMEEDRQCAENANIDFMWAKDWRALAHQVQAFEV